MLTTYAEYWASGRYYGTMETLTWLFDRAAGLNRDDGASFSRYLFMYKLGEAAEGADAYDFARREWYGISTHSLPREGRVSTEVRYYPVPQWLLFLAKVRHPLGNPYTPEAVKPYCWPSVVTTRRSINDTYTQRSNNSWQHNIQFMPTHVTPRASIEGILYFSTRDASNGRWTRVKSTWHTLRDAHGIWSELASRASTAPLVGTVSPYSFSSDDATNLSLCLICNRRIKGRFCDACKNAARTFRMPSASGSDGDADFGKSLERRQLATARLLSCYKGRPCPVHSPDPCRCTEVDSDTLSNNSNSICRLEYSVAPPVPTVRWPSFAVGLELESIAPSGVLGAAASAFIQASLDASIHPENPTGDEIYHNRWAGAEFKVCSWSERAPIHAARAVLLLRRFGAYVNASCGCHVHVDRRRCTGFAEEERLLALWMAVQPWIFKSLFPARANNSYCIPLSCCENHGTPGCRPCTADGALFPRITDHHASLSKSRHGSWEFRVSPGTTNYFHAYAWVEFVVWLWRKATTPRLSKNEETCPVTILALDAGRRLFKASGFANHCMRIWQGVRRLADGDPNKAVMLAVSAVIKTLNTSMPCLDVDKSGLYKVMLDGPVVLPDLKERASVVVRTNDDDDDEASASNDEEDPPRNF